MKTGLDTYLIRIQTRTPLSRYTPYDYYKHRGNFEAVPWNRRQLQKGSIEPSTRFYRSPKRFDRTPKGSIEPACGPRRGSIEPQWKGFHNHRKGSIEPFASNPPFSGSCPRCWRFSVFAGFSHGSCHFMRNHSLSGRIMQFRIVVLLGFSHRLWSNFPKKKGSNFCLFVLPPFHWSQCCCFGVPRWSFSNLLFSHHRLAMRWSSRQKCVATTVFASTGRHLYWIQ